MLSAAIGEQAVVDRIPRPMTIWSACIAGLLVFLIGSFLSVAARAEGVSPTHIVIVSWFEKFRYSRQVQAIEDYLVSQGLRYGVDFEIEYHQVRTQEAVDRLIAAQGRRPFVVFSNTTSPAEFVIRNGTRAPHVFATYSDPVAEHWIESYAHPGGTATGVVEYAPAHARRLELLARLMPNATRFAVILATDVPHPDLTEGIDAFHRAKPGCIAEVIKITARDGAPAIAARLRAARVEAAYFPLPIGGNSDTVVEPLYAALNRQGLPTISERRYDVTRGAVLALEVDRSDLNSRVAHMIGLVLRGVPVGSIPVHSPRRFFLTVNLDAARRLGVAVPASLLRQSQFIIADGK